MKSKIHEFQKSKFSSMSKNLMMFAAVLGLATTITYAQEAPAKTVKTSKKHKTEVVKTETKSETKAAPAKAEMAKTTTTVETKSKTKK